MDWFCQNSLRWASRALQRGSHCETVVCTPLSFSLLPLASLSAVSLCFSLLLTTSTVQGSCVLPVQDFRLTVLELNSFQQHTYLGEETARVEPTK
jgi:hypothetical protein